MLLYNNVAICCYKIVRSSNDSSVTDYLSYLVINCKNKKF
jgi:hypothetical protein